MPTVSPVSSTRTAVLALSVGAFAIGTGEFTIMGLLPEVAADLNVTIPTAGHLIATYAIGVVIGAPLLIAAATRLPRRTVLVGLIGFYGAAHLLSAVLPGYGLVLASRFLAGLPHGAYLGVGALVAGALVVPAKRARAMAMMFAGLTVANIVGVPVSTLIGQALDWRVAFALVGALGLLSAAGVWFLVPDVRPGTSPTRPAPPRLAEEVRALGNRQVWTAMLITVLGGSAMFATFSYVTPQLTEVAGFGGLGVTLVLALYGVGMTVGNFVGARLADWATLRTIHIVLASSVVVALLLVPAMQSRAGAVIGLFVFAVTTFAVVPAVQLRMIDGARHAPTLAAGSMHAAFNIANALGAWAGGLAITAGFGYTSVNVVAALLAASGLVVTVLTGLDARRRAGLRVREAVQV